MDIEKVLERFFDGETTLREEQLLYDFFMSGDVPERLLVYKEMFVDLASVSKKRKMRQSKERKFRFVHVAGAVAACFAGILVLCMSLSGNFKKIPGQESVHGYFASESEVSASLTLVSEVLPDEGASPNTFPLDMDCFVNRMVKAYGYKAVNADILENVNLPGTMYVFRNNKNVDILKLLYLAAFRYDTGANDMMVSYANGTFVLDLDCEADGVVTRHLWIATKNAEETFLYRTRCLSDDSSSVSLDVIIPIMKKDVLYKKI